MRIATAWHGAVLAVAVMLPLSALAAGPNFCRDYARAAIRQSEVARQTPFCARATFRNPARWSLIWRNHFDWCLTVPPGVANGEREARRIHLLECRR